jgi:hypothetical protein
VTLDEMVKEARRLSRQLDNGLDVLRSTVEECAEAERMYRKGRALCWLEAEGPTAAAKEAWVDAETADLRFERDVQEGLKRAAIESVRARAQQISLLQSMLSAHRSEAEFVRTAPQ